MGFLIILGVFTLIGFFITNRLKSKFAHYSKIPNNMQLSGYEIAIEMMHHYGIRGVRIVEGKGMLTDHYNPKTKTVSLSPAVYRGRSVAAAAVAAHEVGHVVQHATAYKYLNMRSSMVPIVQLSSRVQQFLFVGVLAGIGGSMTDGWLLPVLMGTFGVTALFSLVTLPVEFDASNRALVWLESTGVTSGAQYDGAKDSLWWAAMTYVSKALSSLIMFLYFLLIFLNKSNRSQTA